MATTPTPSTSPATPPPPVGTFIQTAASFLVRPSAADATAWRRACQTLTDDIFIESYVVIKLLAPEASRELRIEGWPEVLQIVQQVDERLVQRYLREVAATQREHIEGRLALQERT